MFVIYQSLNGKNKCPMAEFIDKLKWACRLFRTTPYKITKIWYFVIENGDFFIKNFFFIAWTFFSSFCLDNFHNLTEKRIFEYLYL